MNMGKGRGRATRAGRRGSLDMALVPPLPAAYWPPSPSLLQGVSEEDGEVLSLGESREGAGTSRDVPPQRT